MEKGIKFVKKNWLVLELIVVSFLVSIEVLKPGWCWAAIAIPLFVWVALPIVRAFFKKK